MTTVSGPPLQSTFVPGPRPRRWTKEEYHRMGELGWFQDQRVELLEGEIVEMPNPGNPHCVSTDNTAEVLRDVFPRESFWVRMQMPLDLGLASEPQPDVAVAPGPKASFTAHPKKSVLTVEVSDTTLAIDRGRKGSLYARAGLEDYWVVNLNDRQVEVYRQPVPDPAAEYGYRYASVTVLKEGEEVSPLAAPGVRVAVRALLP